MLEQEMNSNEYDSDLLRESGIGNASFAKDNFTFEEYAEKIKQLCDFDKVNFFLLIFSYSSIFKFLIMLLFFITRAHFISFSFHQKVMILLMVILYCFRLSPPKPIA